MTNNRVLFDKEIGSFKISALPNIVFVYNVYLANLNDDQSLIDQSKGGRMKLLT